MFTLRHGVLIAATLAAAGSLASLHSFAADPPAATSGRPPQLSEIVDQLGRGDGKVSSDTLAKLHSAMIEESRQVVIAQKLMLRIQADLAKDLEVLTGVSNAQDQHPTAGLLEFNSAVYRWATEVAGLPDDQRDAVYDWGLKESNLALVAQIYGHNSDAKVEAIHALAKLDPSPATDWLMQTLLNDSDREVSLLTMDALYDRKPTAAMIDILCDKAFGFAARQNQVRITPQMQHTLTLHGRTMTFYDNQLQARLNQSNGQDSDFAADILIKCRDPRVAEKFDDFFWQLLINLGGNNNAGVINILRPIISSNYANSTGIRKLIDVYKPKNAVLICDKVLEMPSTDANEMPYTLNGESQHYRSSSRVDATVMLLNVTGQSLAAYGIVAAPNYTPPRYAVVGSAAEENELLKKVHAWLADHAKDYGIDPLGEFPENPPAANPAVRRGASPPGLP